MNERRSPENGWEPYWRYKSILPRVPASAPSARRALTGQASRWLGPESLVEFELAIGEVLANCVEHASGEEISVDMSCDGARIVVEIADQGPGFTPRIVPPHSENRRGFGLFIVRELMDEVQFLDGGRKVRLERRLDGVEQLRSQDLISRS